MENEVCSIQRLAACRSFGHGEGGHYVAKRLREADRILTAQAVKKLQQAGTKFQGIVGLGSKLHYTLCSYAEMKTEEGQVFCLGILG